MSNIIQQVNFADGTQLYICGFDIDNDILRYRKSTSGKMQISEKVKIEGERVELSDCWFNVAYLQKYLIENEMIEPPKETE
jgi:hypothetical protein